MPPGSENLLATKPFMPLLLAPLLGEGAGPEISWVGSRQYSPPRSTWMGE